MKQRFLVILSIIAMLSSFFSCVKLDEDEDHHFKIYFENHWDKPVYIGYNIDWYWYDNPYEDYGCSFSEEPLTEHSRCHKVQSGGVDSELMTLNEYYESFENQDTVVIRVYNAENPEKKDSESFLVRYHLSKEDLRKVKFHVCYPPTEAMKDFYMKPSYEEVIKQK